jgi:hypothetical protein
VAFGYGRLIWLWGSKLAVKCAVVPLYSVVKQRLKCNTGKVVNCLIQFLLIMVLSIEERVFISAQRLSESTVYVSLFLFSSSKRMMEWRTFNRPRSLSHQSSFLLTRMIHLII